MMPSPTDSRPVSLSRPVRPSPVAASGQIHFTRWPHSIRAQRLYPDRLRVKGCGRQSGALAYHAGIWDTFVCARAVYVNSRSSIVSSSPVGEGLEAGEVEDGDCPVTTTLEP